MKRAVITGIGHAVPERVLTNADLEQMVATSDEWIVQRTGIRQRYVLSPGETATDLSILAAKRAIENAAIDPNEIDMVIVGTVTSDRLFPSTACNVQHAIGAKHSGAMDVSAACAGYIYALGVADALIKSGANRNVLVVGMDVLSRHVDYTDRGTCILFGDGAGATLVSAREGTDRGVLRTICLSDGSGGHLIKLDTGGTLHPAAHAEEGSFNPYIQMAGSEVYRFAVTAINDACCRILEEEGIPASDVSLFVPHQANLRIIRSAQEKLGLPDERVFVNVDRFGNTSGGSIPIALSEAVQMGKLKEGDLILTVGFGAGLVWGANLIRW